MFFLINKPLNLTSFDVIRKLRKILGIKKIGHTGTLDPLATGCLLIATGNSTKLIRFLEKDTKAYKATICLNAFSKTGDKEGEKYTIDKISLEKLKQLNTDKIENIVYGNFVGKIKQVPSKYSAIKINGKSAYKYMREGNEDIKIPEREVEIFNFSELNFYKKDDLYFLDIEVKVGAGTYIRTLGEDIGKKLGVGGYLTKLERLSIGNLNIKDAINLEEMENIFNKNKTKASLFYEKYETKLGDIFPNFPIIPVKSELIKKILQGKKILKKEINLNEIKNFKLSIRADKNTLENSNNLESKFYDHMNKYLFIKHKDVVCLLEQEGQYFKITKNNVV